MTQFMSKVKDIGELILLINEEYLTIGVLKKRKLPNNMNKALSYYYPTNIQK